jgi:SHS2 domain-containing protein
LGALFAEAGSALSQLLLRGAAASRDDRVREIMVSSPDREALLVDWLNEILYVAETECWVPVQFDVVEISETSVRARIRGVPVREAPSLVKATTHHRLQVEEVEGVLQGEVIFDL